MINVLIIAVLGGMKHPIGAFIGALVFVLLQNFAIDLVDRERFNLVIGGVFLAIVLFSPDGLLGLWQHLRTRLSARVTHPRQRPHPSTKNRSET
jgi:branched-chain amino acid transport system permease protein